MNAEPSHPRWFYPTPGRAVVGLLAVEGVLLASQHFRWFPFNQHKGYTVLVAVGAVLAFMAMMLLWFLAALIFRLRFQFSIRSLLLLMVAVAVPCSWLATEMKAAREQERAVEAIQKLDGCVRYDLQDADGNAEPSGPERLRKLLGADCLVSVVEINLNATNATDAGLEHLKGLAQLQHLSLDGTQVTDAGLEHLKGLTQLQGLLLDHTQVTDAGLKHLKGMTQLQWLSLIGNTQVTDAGLEHLKGLAQLQYLWLDGTQVTDAGLEHLKGLIQLQELWLCHTNVTDAGLEHLQGLTQLQGLYLGGTQVTDEGVQKLKQALPNCIID
jgi:hypothetical protein